MVGQPVRANRLQVLLLAGGDAWAEGRVGYITIWGLLNQMRDAGVLSGRGNTGFQLVADDLLADVFAASIAQVLQDSVPDIEALEELKREMLDLVLRFAARAQKQKEQGT